MMDLVTGTTSRTQTAVLCLTGVCVYRRVWNGHSPALPTALAAPSSCKSRIKHVLTRRRAPPTRTSTHSVVGNTIVLDTIVLESISVADKRLVSGESHVS